MPREATAGSPPSARNICFMCQRPLLCKLTKLDRHLNMAASLLSAASSFMQLKDHLNYPESGVLKKVIWKSEACEFNLVCLASSTEVPKHSSTSNVTVQIIEGTGIFTLREELIDLTPGVIIFVEANSPHSLCATTELAFILTKSS